MHDLTANEYESVWTAGEGLRQDTKKRRDYYDGNHAIVGDQQFYVDGSAKSQRVSNFVRFGIDLYTGSIAGTPYNLTEIEIEAEEGEEVEANLSPERYREIGGFNNFAAGDVENLRNALIAGFGIETHEFMDDQIVITSRDTVGVGTVKTQQILKHIWRNRQVVRPRCASSTKQRHALNNKCLCNIGIARSDSS